jgi:hypothetical protein
MKPRLNAVRAALATLMIVFGVVITARGIVESAPFTFVAMGALLALLGALRLGLLGGRAR